MIVKKITNKVTTALLDRFATEIEMEKPAPRDVGRRPGKRWIKRGEVTNKVYPRYWYHMPGGSFSLRLLTVDPYPDLTAAAHCTYEITFPDDASLEAFEGYLAILNSEASDEHLQKD